METGFAEQLKFADVAETVQAVDKPRILAGSDASAVILEVVDEFHPALVIMLPGYFIFRRPIKPVRTVVGAAGRVMTPHRRERVLLVPLRSPRAHQVAVGFVNGEGRVDGEVELDQLIADRIPLLAPRFGRLQPEAAGIAEPVLLIRIVVAEREVLYRPIFK